MHDHVAGIYDFGETEDGFLYLAMEYVPGDTVARMVKAEGPFELTRVAELARQIASGLDAAHAQRIIHRDLKPDNIKIMRDRHGRALVKIVDFGIAKALGTGLVLFYMLTGERPFAGSRPEEVMCARSVRTERRRTVLR